ncbi:MAG: transcriptional repressor [Candidatus Magasanikbacteria bacterium]|nr:transcriptional repressor [Candidatus Magasanikbacteria bacterium]
MYTSLTATQLEQKVSDAGLKRTASRRAIYTYITQHEGLFSAADILATHKKLDKVSVYRTLESLEKLDIIHRAAVLDGHQMYELHQEKKDHHHHIVCVMCKKDACVPCDISDLPKKIKGFTTVHHAVHFTGVCRDCAVA